MVLKEKLVSFDENKRWVKLHILLPLLVDWPTISDRRT